MESIIGTLYGEISDRIPQAAEHTNALEAIRQIVADTGNYESVEEQVGAVASSATFEGFKAGFIAGMKLAAEIKA